MISYVEALSQNELSSIPNSSVKTRILAMFLGYGASFDFLDFWLQRNEEETTAAICRFSGEVWVAANSNADFCELLNFCKVVAPVVLTDLETANKMGLDPEIQFLELSKLGKSSGDAECFSQDVMALYDRLTSGFDGDIEILDKNEWYADMSHRFRHGVAKWTLSNTAAALAGFVTEESALITGVSVDESARGKGEGRAVLDDLCAALGSRRIYAEASEKTAEFYKKCGFEISAKLCRCKLC